MKPGSPRRLCLSLFYLFVCLGLTACGGNSSSGGGQGTLATSLTDSSTDEYQAVYVTISRVDVHHEGDGVGVWETVATPDRTYDLLVLVNGVRETLGVETLAAGHYTQMRLIIGRTPDDGRNLFGQTHPYANYIVDRDDAEIHELKIPSGTNSGLKIVNGFDINANQTTELILDFDAMRSVVMAGASGQYLLKPTVKVLRTIDYALVTGTVTDTATPPVALAGALVTAQSAAPLAVDVIDQVVIATGTVTNIAGHYSMPLLAGDYNLVAAKNGYLAGCTAVSLLEDSTTTVDFHLAPAAAPGMITGTVTIGGAQLDPFATIDFRRSADCGAGATMITVKSAHIGDGGTYNVTLPPGDYTVVAAATGQPTQSATVTVLSGAVTTNNLTFVSP
jgi:hypothetical protein